MFFLISILNSVQIIYFSFSFSDWINFIKTWMKIVTNCYNFSQIIGFYPC